MMTSKIVFVVVMVMTAMLCDAQEGNKGEDLLSESSQNSYNWKRQLQDGSTVKEKAFKVPENSILFFLSNDKDLKGHSMVGTMAIYFNDNGQTKEVLIPFRPLDVCFIASSSLALDNSEPELQARNTSYTAIPAGQFKVLNASVKPMSQEDAQDLFSGVPLLTHVCRGRKVIETAPLAKIPDNTDGLRAINLLTYDGHVSIVSKRLKHHHSFHHRSKGGQRGHEGHGQGQGDASQGQGSENELKKTSPRVKAVEDSDSEDRRR